jgi:hypothetical protein
LLSEWKSLSELLKKSKCLHLKKKIDSLPLKPLGLYINVLGLFVAYSQPFNLVYK